MTLDAAGVGKIDPSCSNLLEDIPSTTDRRIVESIFNKLNARARSRSNSPTKHSRSASLALPGSILDAVVSPIQSSDSREPLSPIASVNGLDYPSGSLQVPLVSWSLTLEEFTAQFLLAYKLLVQREGPQASAGVLSTRGSAQQSRIQSGAVTPGIGAAGAGANASHSRRGSFYSQNQGSLLSGHTREPSEPHSFLHSGSGLGGKGHSRRGSALSLDLGSTGICRRN